MAVGNGRFGGEGGKCLSPRGGQVWVDKHDVGGRAGWPAVVMRWAM